MAKRKAPFPIYCVSEFQHVPKCDEGKDCNPAENPAHHVDIDLSPGARDVIQRLIECLGERHADEVAARHHGDLGGARTCSYCQAIKDGLTLLKFADEGGR